MADRASIEKARRELEELYSGVPDDSVNLTFQDLAEVRNHQVSETTNHNKERKDTSPILSKIPSLDFNNAFLDNSIRVNIPRPTETEIQYDRHHSSNHVHQYHHRGEMLPRHVRLDNDMMSGPVSGTSFTGSILTSPYSERGGRRRPGIPHSNICTVCTNYIYVCRNRCLVCGRVYCRQCVDIGMGEMIEGRKCIDCLGRRFSQRYIQRAGNSGCCFKFRYPKMIIQQELKWAEKGPRRNGERRYDQSSMMMSRSRSPLPQSTPSRAHLSSPSPSPNPNPSFVTSSSPYSAYSPTRHHLPF